MKTKTQQTHQRQPRNSSNLTFLEHLTELRTRLFWVVGTVLAASMLAFPFQQEIINVVVAPLGGQQLYYLTPAGGFSFIIRLSLYVGVLVAIPVAMYHLYRYLEPLFSNHRRRVVRYTSLSAVLALAGAGFAYFVSLPAALHFLTGVGASSVQAMLTTDAYLSFIMTYVLVAALLFQLPLILLIINTITPLKPGRLLGAMRFVVVGAFVVAAIISPTPDVVNQALLAVPMIVMYGVGVGMVWWRNRGRVPIVNAVQPSSPIPLPQTASAPVAVNYVVHKELAVPMAQTVNRSMTIDGFYHKTTKHPVQSTRPVVQRSTRPMRSIDGIMAANRLPLSPIA